jgi:hypothetical protein
MRETFSDDRTLRAVWDGHVGNARCQHRTHADPADYANDFAACDTPQLCSKAVRINVGNEAESSGSVNCLRISK